MGISDAIFHTIFSFSQIFNILVKKKWSREPKYCTSNHNIKMGYLNIGSFLTKCIPDPLDPLDPFPSHLMNVFLLTHFISLDLFKERL